VTSSRQPGLQTRLGSRQIHTGHANLGKCKLLAPGLYLRDELSGIQSDIHGKPIVGTVPAPAGTVSAPVRWQGRWTTEEDTQAFARQLATCPAIAHATLTLQGDLGAGKTTLVRHLLRALGVRGRIKSPTYAVVEPHSTIDCAVMPAGEPLLIWHFDFYRFNDPREWEDAGFRELFASPGLKLVEWPERAGDFLPPVDLRIDIEPDEMTPHAHIDLDQDTHRKVSATALTPTGRLLLEALA
jgi:tRNA threonylcarbamoyladenosine biosynthesis protein TsaE